MLTREQIHLNKIEQEAEGYLELQMPRQVLAVLKQLPETTVRERQKLLWLQAEALRLLGHLQEAEECLFFLQNENFPFSPDVILSLAECQKTLGEYKKATATLQKGLDFQPENAMIYYSLACCFALMKDNDTALKTLEKAFEYDPSLKMMIAETPAFSSFQKKSSDFRWFNSIGS